MSGVSEAAEPEVQFRTDVTVELVRSSASDADVLFAARVSTLGRRPWNRASADPDRAAEGPTARDRGLINYLMRDRQVRRSSTTR